MGTDGLSLHLNCRMRVKTMVTDLNNEKEVTMNDSAIHTTVGDLVFAIVEAAEEARIDEGDLEEYTSLILNRILRANA